MGAENGPDRDQSSVQVAHKLGNPNPKVALLCAVEVVNPDMPETVNAALISKMNDRGQIKGCIIDGPPGLDNAISFYAARKKGIKSEVAGDADILIVPGIAAGNIFAKSLEYYGHCKFGVIVTGTSSPVLIPSRAHKSEIKLNSIALAIVLSL